MKRSKMPLNKMKVLPLVAGMVLTSAVAQAEPMRPSGTFEEAKLHKVQTVSQPASVTAKVSSWIKTKWTGMSWGSSAPASTNARRQVAVPRQPASAQGRAAVATTSNYVPRSVASKLSAPVAAPTTDDRGPIDPPGVTRTSEGVAVYDLGASPSVPRLKIGREDKIKASKYGLDDRMQQVMNDRVLHPFASPDLLLPAEFNALQKIATGMPTNAKSVRDVVFSPKGKVNREAFDKLVINLKPEMQLKLANFKELTQDEMRLLSGLLLYQQGDKCAAAVGIFHKLSKSSGFQAEADYYLAMCSRKLGLETDFFERATRILESQDVHYSRKILKEVGYDIPYEFTDRLGLALFKIAQPGEGAKTANPTRIMDKLDPKIQGNIAYLITEFAASTERFKTALDWSAKVPDDHPRRLQSRFLRALAEYQSGSKDRALKSQEELISDLGTDKEKAEFQALVALNVARMYFQEQKFKPAHEAFLKVYKDHPMWLTSLTEMAWSQLQSGDYEGAIGNMYSIQSPFFTAVYKPESYVIRTVGYLNLCQYGDAYRTLSILERDYRPYLDRMEKYTSAKPQYYQTVKNFMNAPKGAKEVDGLPVQVIREMARHRDFTNMQKALNRQIDERVSYAKLEGEVEKSLKRAQWLATNSRRRIDDLRKQLGLLKKKPELEQNRVQWQVALEKEMDELNGHFFQVDLFTDAKKTLPDYRKDVVGGAEKRLTVMRGQMERTLSNRLLRLKTDLARILENNELLRYEVFAGSGENIRYQVAGGEKGNRVAASVIPKSKSLQWDFDGEYWEDEIGHYRSSLKNNCPEAARIQHASIEGEVE